METVYAGMEGALLQNVNNNNIIGLFNYIIQNDIKEMSLNYNVDNEYDIISLVMPKKGSGFSSCISHGNIDIFHGVHVIDVTIE